MTLSRAVAGTARPEAPPETGNCNFRKKESLSKESFNAASRYPAQGSNPAHLDTDSLFSSDGRAGDSEAGRKAGETSRKRNRRKSLTNKVLSTKVRVPKPEQGSAPSVLEN